MKKVFWQNPYQHILETQVTAVDGNEILFAETIAYSFAGGQESDKACINNIPVLHSRIKGNLIYYTLPENHHFQVGDKITMTIDWHSPITLNAITLCSRINFRNGNSQLPSRKSWRTYC